MADTFQTVADAPYGTAMLLVMAGCFLAFDVYCVLLAARCHMPNEELDEQEAGADGEPSASIGASRRTAAE